MRKYNFTSSPIKNFFKKNGFYCALGVALLGLGISAYSAISSTVDILTPEPMETVSETPAQQTVSGVKAEVSEIESEAEISSAVSQEEKEETDVKPQETQLEYPDCFMLPVEGKVSAEYSDSQPVFNTTLEDWRVHNAVDFEAKEGTKVKAVAEGIVESIDYDESYGYIVKVNHGGGLTASYCNLQRNILVEEGQTLDMGDVLGGVGDGSYMECSGPHLHFETYIDEKSVDPLTVLEVRE